MPKEKLMSQQTHTDDPLDPVVLAKRILRNEDAETVLRDSVASLIFPEEVEGWRKNEQKHPEDKIPSFRKLYWLAMCLKKVKQFEYARKILNRAQNEARTADHVPQSTFVKIIQQRALCTYKDTYLPAGDRLDNALLVLKELKSIQTKPSQETLGLFGGIYKRKWEMDGTKQNLERSLAYYRQGYLQGITNDYGYTSINAAFILDLVANAELEGACESGTDGEPAIKKMAEAKKIRGEIKETLQHLLAHEASLGEAWWFLMTLAEACFGREEYTEAAAWLSRAKTLRDKQEGVPVCSNKVPEWELESTARQLASLARVQEHNARLVATLSAVEQPSAPAAAIDEEALPSVPTAQVKNTKAWNVVREFLGNEAGVETAYAGKVGLALSGGGFRASLFHIGVLAKLAELDVLRHVEVLSCVSGGSIIGAYYYLEVRKLLKDTPDLEIDRKHYVEIVQRIEKKFLEGVKTNIRTRIASKLGVNFKMFLDSAYTPTNRAGELYEENLYSKIDDKEGDKPRRLQDLIITPQGEPKSFTPKFNNWRRRAKAPILILNATTLNTGHNWHFTATYMGESPASIIPEIDGNCRLRRMYYRDEAPEKHKDITLGSAVAASACVPALFNPLVLEDLYEQNMTVRLVDGGVHDNQGIAGLLEQDCTVLLVSDASGQMKTVENPSGNPLGVSLRSNNVLMARVREAEYRELIARRRSSLLSGLMYIHLRQDIQVDPINWLKCKDRYQDSDEYKEAQRKSSQWTTYGISKNVQERLALIRTDLDSFSEVEAYSLMLSGYYMTGNQLTGKQSRRNISSLPMTEGLEEKWKFKEMDELVRDNAPEKARAEFLQLLEVGQKRGFKLWQLSPALRRTGRVLKIIGSLALLAALVMLPLSLYLGWFSQGFARWAGIILGIFILPLVLAILLGRLKLKRTRRLQGKLIRVLVGLGLSPLMWLAAGTHLRVFDERFLKRGSLARMQLLQGKTPQKETN
jgi:predicted acylesterase/phospholipase RssA